MTERPNQQPEFMRWDTGGTVSRMRAILSGAGQLEGADKDMLLQYMAAFNSMLGADEDHRPPLSVVFETGPDIYKHDKDGQLIAEADGLVKYGILERCIVYEDLDQGLTKLMAQIRLHVNDRADFGFEGTYCFELASLGDELSLGEARVHEIERPSMDLDVYDPLLYSEKDRELGEQLDYCANAIDEWRGEYLKDGESASIAKLLNYFVEMVEELPDDQAERHMIDQSTAFNLMLNSPQDDLRLVAWCNGVAEEITTDSKIEGRVVQAIDMQVYAIDAAWQDGRIKGYLYCIDSEGRLVRCQLSTDAIDIRLSEGDLIDFEDEDG